MRPEREGRFHHPQPRNAMALKHSGNLEYFNCKVRIGAGALRRLKDTIYEECVWKEQDEI
jgi:hypothetical protein